MRGTLRLVAHQVDHYGGTYQQCTSSIIDRTLLCTRMLQAIGVAICKRQCSFCILVIGIAFERLQVDDDQLYCSSADFYFNIIKIYW